MFSDHNQSKEVPSSQVKLRDKINEPALVQQNTSFDTLIPDGVPEAANDSLLAPWPGLELGSSVNLSQNSKAVLSQELKMLRLRISDYNKSPVIDAVCQKIWKLIIVHQYDEKLLELITHPSTLPIHIDLYEAVTPLFQSALGIYYHTNYYVARQETATRYGSTNVFYPRFMYDLISMFGLNLFYIELPTLEFLLRRVYQSVSFVNAQHRVRLLSFDSIKPAFTEQEYTQVINNNINKNQREEQDLTVPDSQQKQPTLQDEDDDQFNDLLALGKDADERKRVARIKKQEKLKLLQKEKNLQKEFEFLPQTVFLKHDPVKALAYLKRNKVFPLNAQPKQIEHLTEVAESNDQIQQTESQNVDSLSKIQPTAQVDKQQQNRQHTLKVYEHLQQFCTADMEEALEFEEKQKMRRKHEETMRKLDSRPDHIKLKQFLKYEKMNLKSHLYNQSNKTDKMYRELNAVQYKPRANESLGEKSVKQVEDEQLLKMYSPIIELKKDELASHNQSIQQILQMKQQQESLMQQSLRYQSNLRAQQEEEGVKRWTTNSAIRVSSDTGKVQRRNKRESQREQHQQSDVSSIDQQEYMRSNQKFLAHSVDQRKMGPMPQLKPELQVQGIHAGQLPAIRLNQSMQDPLTLQTQQNYDSQKSNSLRNEESIRYKKPASLMHSVDETRKKYASAFMRPTECQSVREHLNEIDRQRASQDLYNSINSHESRDPTDGRVWIHDVTMGDFQLQNWRSIRRKKPDRNYVKVMNTVV